MERSVTPAPSRATVLLTAPIALPIYLACGVWWGLVKFAADLKRDWKAAS